MDYLQDVVALSATNVWAVGYAAGTKDKVQTVILHGNGSSWRRVASPSPGSAENYLAAVAAVPGTGQLWAVGVQSDHRTTQPLMLRWDGLGWLNVAVNAPPNSFLRSVVALTPVDPWAVGGWHPKPWVTRTLLLHWDGVRWQQVPTPDPGPRDNILGHLLARSPRDIWAFGSYTTDTFRDFHPLALHWDGRTWRAVALPVKVTGLGAAVATSPLDFWVSAARFHRDGSNDGILFEHWNGVAWQLVTPPDPGDGAVLADMDSVDGQVWAVGHVSRRTGNAGRGRVFGAPLRRTELARQLVMALDELMHPGHGERQETTLRLLALPMWRAMSAIAAGSLPGTVRDRSTYQALSNGLSGSTNASPIP